MKHLTFVTLLLVAIVSTPVSADPVDQAAKYLCSAESIELSNKALGRAIEQAQVVMAVPGVTPAELSEVAENISLAQHNLESLVLLCAILKALGVQV